MPSLTFLGTGGSYGVPTPGCNCETCRREFDPFAKWYRTRASALVQSGGKNLLVDASQDFREQALRNKIKKIDACLVTHAHADATLGIADLRSFSREKKIPIFSDSRTIRTIRKRFSYAFSPRVKTSKPQLELLPIPKKMAWHGLRISPFPVFHPPMRTNGFRINDLAYISDIKKLSPASKARLKGIKTLVISGDSDIAYLGHQTIFESIKLAKELEPKRVFFTHIGHRIDRLNIKLPRGMRLAYDGLKIKF